MKRAGVLCCLLVCFFASPLRADSTPPDELLRVVPDSIGDLTEIVKQAAYFKPQYKFHSCERSYVKPGTLAVNGILADPGYTLMSTTWYYYEKTPPALTEANDRIAAVMESYAAAQPAGRIAVNGYPVGYFVSRGTDSGKIILFTAKDKYEIAIFVHFRRVSEAGADALARKAYADILSRIDRGLAAKPAPAAKPAIPPATPSAAEQKQRADRAELAKMRGKWDGLEEKIKRKYSGEYQAEQEKQRLERAEKAEDWRQSREEQADFETMAALMLGAAAVQTPVQLPQKVVCGGVEFSFRPELLQKIAKAGERFETGRWEEYSFIGPEKEKEPPTYTGKYFIPVAYLAGDEITGYVWLDQGGEVVRTETANRALFAYLYTFGFAPAERIKKESAEFAEDARRNDEELQSYAYYKEYSKTLKLASNAVGVYLGALSGLGAGTAVSAGLSGADAALFLQKVNALERQKPPPPEFTGYEDYVGAANDLDSLKTLGEGLAAARRARKLTGELAALKDAEKITAQTKLAAANADLLKAAASLGWTLFDAAEGTGQIAERSAVLSIKYSELKNLNLFLAANLEEALNGVDDDRELNNLLLLHELKAKRYRLKGELAAALLQSYQERKKTLSGYAGRFLLYAQGKPVDETAARQTIYDLEFLVDQELNGLYETKINTDVATSLAVQRAAYLTRDPRS